MQEELISVVIPIYNVEKYVKRCIESVLKQTYHKLQILLIDDGSTDTSGSIADYYAEKNGFEVYHKENGGLSSARNYGLDKVKGQYVLFIDSDDWVSNDYIEYLYYLAKDYNAEIARCLFKRVSNESTIYTNRDSKTYLWTSEMGLKKMLRQEDGMTTSACTSLYDIRCFKGIRFPEGKYYEDLGTIYKVLGNAKRIVHSNRALYYYYKREGSIANQIFTNKHFNEYEFANDIVNYVKRKYPNLVFDAETRLVGVCFHLYMMMSNDQIQDAVFRKYADIFVKIIKDNKCEMIFSMNTPQKVRMGCLSTIGGMRMSRGIYKYFGIYGK